MTSCENCNLILDSDTIYCPRCGRKIVAVDPAKSRGRIAVDQVRMILAEARTFKVRLDWDNSVERCIDALKIDPDSPDVYSVLGEIYEAQGKVEQALQWYQMADVEYSSSGVSTEDLKNRIRCLESCRCDNAQNVNWYDRFVVGARFSSSLRIITAVLVGFLLVLILGAAFVNYADKRRDRALEQKHSEIMKTHVMPNEVKNLPIIRANL